MKGQRCRGVNSASNQRLKVIRQRCLGEESAGHPKSFSEDDEDRSEEGRKLLQVVFYPLEAFCFGISHSRWSVESHIFIACGEN